MGLYLNSRRPRNNYLEIVRSDYFTDKTMMLKELFPFWETVTLYALKATNRLDKAANISVLQGPDVLENGCGKHDRCIFRKRI